MNNGCGYVPPQLTPEEYCNEPKLKVVLIGKDANVYSEDKILLGKAKVRDGKLIIEPLT